MGERENGRARGRHARGCCQTNWIRVLTWFVARQARTWVVKRVTSLYSSFCSNVAKKSCTFFVANSKPKQFNLGFNFKASQGRQTTKKCGEKHEEIWTWCKAKRGELVYNSVFLIGAYKSILPTGTLFRHVRFNIVYKADFWHVLYIFFVYIAWRRALYKTAKTRTFHGFEACITCCALV